LDFDRLLAWRDPVAAGAAGEGRVDSSSAALPRVVIPVHRHAADEYVLVLSGTIETGGRRCETGTFWITPAGTHQGPHVAITDVELLTARLGAIGPFGEYKMSS